METKKCTKCGEVKPLGEYCKSKRYKDGFFCYCKQCKNKVSERWRKANPEKVKERQKRFYEKNPEKVKEIKKRWCENNPEKIKEKNKRFYEKNTEKVKEKSKRYRENNPEKQKQWQKRFSENNPEKIKEIKKRFRENNPEYNTIHNLSRKFDIPISEIPEEIKELAKLKHKYLKLKENETE